MKDQALKKHIKKELPRVEKELNAVLVQWEEDHERFFMVHDSRYLDTIQLQWTEKKMIKCNEKVKRVSCSSLPLTLTYLAPPLRLAKPERSFDSAGDDIWQ